MKTVFNIVLVLCAAALIYICYTSIMGPINFENAKKEREKAVIARLIDIRKAQQEYRSLHRGMYAPKLDTLIDFVKNQKLPFVMKMGMLTDKQLEDGLTEKKAMAIIEKAKEFLSLGATVCAICGATAALADFKLLDARPHTSNGPGFLERVSPRYKGQSFYIDKPSVADNNLITAGCAGALLWTKQIIGRLGVFETNTLEAWYDYFSSGKPEHFFALMQTLPSGDEN